MQDLWGDAFLPVPSQRKKKSIAKHIGIGTSQDCHYYGHTWGMQGFHGEKLCLACGIKGYCPVCTPVNAPADASPFYCSAHSEGSVQT